MNDEVEAGPMCTGDCDEDSDCDAGLLCYQRDFTFNTPPGCRPQVSANECENALNECDVVDQGATQTNLDFIHVLVNFIHFLTTKEIQIHDMNSTS